MRLQNWDYGWDSSYFITINTTKRHCFFGNIPKDEMSLSEIGKLAHDYWVEIPEHFPFVILGAHVVMPNHVHGIITIDKSNSSTSQSEINIFLIQGKDSISKAPENGDMHISARMANISPKQGSLSTIIRSYKSEVTKSARKLNPNFGWPSLFHDHIIRNQKSYRNIESYIINNPKKWNDDRSKM